MSPDCEGCGTDLNVRSVERPNVDWLKVVCSSCGEVNHVSMIRIAGDKE